MFVGVESCCRRVDRDAEFRKTIGSSGSGQASWRREGREGSLMGTVGVIVIVSFGVGIFGYYFTRFFLLLSSRVPYGLGMV